MVITRRVQQLERIAPVLLPPHGRAALGALDVVAGLPDLVLDLVPATGADAVTTGSGSFRAAHSSRSAPLAAPATLSLSSAFSSTHDCFSFCLLVLLAKPAQPAGHVVQLNAG
jgi:hypothetical protein